MLLLIRQIQRVAEFEESYEVNVELNLIGFDDIKKQAQEIDKEDYLESCFGVDFNYIKDEDMLYIINYPKSIYYIDNNGEKNYFEVNEIAINNIMRVLLIEMRKFKQDKEKYIKDNNINYEEV